MSTIGSFLMRAARGKKSVPKKVGAAAQAGSPRIALVLVFLYAIFGVAFAWICPPFLSPDEYQHFLRSYQISEGALIGVREGGSTGGVLPWVLAVEHDSLEPLVERGDRKLSWGEIFLPYRSSPPLTPESTQRSAFLSFSNTSLYAPIPYLPQAFAMFLGRTVGSHFGIRVLDLLMGGRLAVVFTCSLIYFLSFKALGEDKKSILILFLVFGTPIGLFEMASLSADGITNALCCLVISLCIALTRHWRKVIYFNLLLAAGMLSLCKGVYFPVGFLGLIGILKWNRKGAALRPSLGLALSILIPWTVWAYLTRGLFSPYRLDIPVDPKGQLAFIFSHPFQTLLLFLHSNWNELGNYREGFIGILGFQTVHLPKGAVSVLWDVMLIVPWLGNFACDYRPPLLGRAWHVFLAFFLFLLIDTSVYLTWNSVGAPSFVGMQARYLIPVAAVLISAAPSVMRLDPLSYGRIVLPACVILWAYCLGSSLRTFGKFYWS